MELKPKQKSIVMKKLFSILALTSIAFLSQAQSVTNGKITGSIKDGGIQKVIDAATVSLLKAKDSSLVKAAITDKDGNFSFENIKEGNYLILATSVGHGKTYSSPISINSSTQNQQIGVLQLVQTSQNLKEVTVTAKKQFIERKADKTVINVDAMISNTGTTALEVLEKSPGVVVDKDGNISLKGKQGVTIMIDGKPSFLSGAELASMLQNMSSSQLDQIELITNPSAKYDASGTAGIINIKTKKNKQKGFNGNVSEAYGQGFYPKNNSSLGLNYRNGKFNVFSNFGSNYRKRFNDLNILRKYKNIDESYKSIFEQSAFKTNIGESYNGKIGVDFYASSKTTIGIVLTGITSKDIQPSVNTTFFKNGLNVLDSIAVSTSDVPNKWKNGSANINFRHQFDSTGKEITIDLDYLNYAANKKSNLDNEYYTNNWQLKNSDHLIGNLPTNINVYSAKMDFALPLKKAIKVEMGLKSSFVNTKNKADYFNVINNTKEVDVTKTNNFNYKENINAAYVNISKQLKKWSLQAGLRMENTNNSGFQFGNPISGDSSFKNSYVGLFPNGFVNYEPNEKNQFSLSYGRRITRPDYEDMNPFLYYIDNYTYDQGNPFLKPAIANVFEASHTYKQILTTTLGYTHTKDLFTAVFKQRGFATVVSQDNFGSSSQATLSVNAQLKLAKWWMAIPYVEVNYSSYKGSFNTENVNVNATTFLTNITNQFTFKKGWSAELSGFYRTKGIEGQIVIRPMGQLNVGVQKQLLKNKLTVKFNVRDLLNTMQPSGYLNISNTDASFNQKRDNRTATISFNYRFGKPIKGIQKRKTGGAGDEQNRIKGGN